MRSLCSSQARCLVRWFARYIIVSCSIACRCWVWDMRVFFSLWYSVRDDDDRCYRGVAHSGLSDGEDQRWSLLVVCVWRRNPMRECDILVCTMTKCDQELPRPGDIRTDRGCFDWLCGWIRNETNQVFIMGQPVDFWYWHLIMEYITIWKWGSWWKVGQLIVML